MHKAFSYFAHGACEDTGLDIYALCVYIDARCELSAHDLFDELTAALQAASVVPDCVLVIADESATQKLLGYWQEEESRRETFQSRCEKKGVPFVKCYQFVVWCSRSGLSVIHTEGAGPEPYFKLPLLKLIRHGLEALVRKNPVAQIAPAGHVFKHPSKTVSKLFIQTRELATSEPELSFLGRCLAGHLDAFRLPDLAHVYIDSMGIYAMVHEALVFTGSTARIHSFHSYDELSEQTPPTLPYAVVISASTTGGMARTLYEKQGFDETRILTIIDSSREHRHSATLIALDEIDDSYKKRLRDGTETQIELYGEHFASKAKPPRAVTLGLSHKPSRLEDFLKEFGTNGVLDLNASASPSGRPANRLVCVDTSSVGSSAKLKEWLKEEIHWRVATAINHIIYADDAGSKELAEHAATLLQEARNSSTTPKVLCYDDLDDLSLKGATGVLIIQALAGDGGLLREISRDLREYLKQCTPRHFLAGVGLPQSADTWARLRQFLVRNASNREYGFSAWFALPIGADSTATAWQAYAELFAESQLADLLNESLPRDVAMKSIVLATETYQSVPNGFFPTPGGDKLVLTDGFVFFGKAFEKVSEVSDATAFATVAAVLQAARDLNSSGNQLRPNGYESVVLDPENFLRFNDNLLQACILRAAHPAELDYSSSPQHSRLMKEFLLKLFARHARPYGGAALEFAAALASGRLRLLASDLEEVRDKAIAQLKEVESPLLGLICLIK